LINNFPVLVRAPITRCASAASGNPNSAVTGNDTVPAATVANARSARARRAAGSFWARVRIEKPEMERAPAYSSGWPTCHGFDVPVGKAALSHHFAVLRGAGIVEQRDEGPRRVNRLRREEFEGRFPGLLGLVLRENDRG
jgi:DNA-binding transcriptional ArsR family regulator